MKDSVALLLAAQAALDQGSEDVVVARLCRTFNVDSGDAHATLAAARLLADSAGRVPLRD